ncbi:MAG: hypothetical protein AB1757_11550 [Acidobacteriota bacterium]
MKLSHKFATLCAIAAGLPILIILAVALYSLSSSTNLQIDERLKKEAQVALSVVEKRRDGLRSAAQQLAVDVANKALVSSDNQATDAQQAWARLQDLLPRAQNDFNLDFVLVADPTGRVIARHNGRPMAGETIGDASAKNPLAEKVISDGIQLRNAPQSSIVVESGERLAKLGLEQLAQVQAMGDSGKVKVTDALMVEAAAAIFSNGRFVGMVLLGQMLNNYLVAKPGANDLQTPLIAEARQTLQLDKQSGQGVIVAYNNVVIASSLTSATGNTGLLNGADLKSIQADVLEGEGGRPYAFALQPLKSIDGATVGAIGVAYSTDSISGSGSGMKFLLAGIGLLMTGLAGFAGYYLGNNLAMRVNTLIEATDRMSVGELSAPVRDDAAIGKPVLPEFLLNDEVAKLAIHLDDMRESFRQAIERLRKR